MSHVLPRKYFLVLDLGTGSGRSVVYDELGTELGYDAQEWCHPEDPRYPGSVDFDTERNWGILCECIRGAIKKSGIAPSQITAVSATGMRIGTVFYDKDGTVLFACTNTDTRADAQTSVLVDRGLGPKIYEIDGEWPGLGGPSVTLLWLREHEPQIYKQISHVTMLTDWMLYKLSGEYSVDPSCAGTSGMFNGRERRWSSEIAGWLDIPMEILAPVNESGVVIGTITRQAAEETGLPEGLPVAQGGSDAGCGLAGRAVVRPGQAAAGGGTFWNASIIADEMVLDPEARAKILPHIVPGLWQLEGVCFYAGHMVRWFRDAFCLEEKQLARQLGTDAYKILDEQAAQIPPGAYGVQASVAGVIDTKRWVVPPPTFMGWSIDLPQQSTKTVFYRALLENAAFQIRGTFELLYDLTGVQVSEVPIGGGVAKSHLWPQILADVLQMKIKVPVVKEGAALGAAMCAAVGVGVYEELPEAAQAMVSWEATYYPTSNNEVLGIYDAKFKQWIRLFSHLMELVDARIMPPMWKAAGVRIGSVAGEL